MADFTFDSVREALSSGSRVLLLVRHAERPHIDHDDPTFGAALPLTETGRETSVAFGRRLRDAATDIQFRASPLRRTVMTAECIAEGLGRAGAPIVQDDAIGNGSPFFSDRLEVWRQFRDGRFFDKLSAYLRDGVFPGFAPNAAAADAYEEYVLSHFTSRLGIFTTHDIFIVAYLFARKVRTDWTFENWPRFLDAAAVVLHPDGARTYHFLSAGLSDRAIGVGAAPVK